MSSCAYLFAKRLSIALLALVTVRGAFCALDFPSMGYVRDYVKGYVKKMNTDDTPPDLIKLLIQHRDQLERAIRQKAAGLIRFESANDLVQGIHMHALRVEEKFEYLGDQAFKGWLMKIAEQHIADRHRYWNAKKRKAERMIQLSGTQSEGSESPGRVDPVSPNTGPFSFAAREDDVDLALEAIKVLKERDQQFVHWMSEGLSTGEVAERLEITESAAERGRLRAIERFRKAFEIILRKRGEQ